MTDWIRDGHALKILIEDDTLALRFECPNEGDHTGKEWDAIPSCRKCYDENGQPDPDNGPLNYCNFAEFATNLGSMDSIDRSVTRGKPLLVNGEMMIGWRWSPSEETYLWAPSELLDGIQRPQSAKEAILWRQQADDRLVFSGRAMADHTASLGPGDTLTITLTVANGDVEKHECKVTYAS